MRYKDIVTINNYECVIETTDFDEECSMWLRTQNIVDYDDFVLSLRNNFLFKVSVNGTTLAYIKLRVACTNAGDLELVIAHGVTHKKLPGMTYILLDGIFDRIATAYNCKTIRIHTNKSSMDRLIQRKGYVYAESIYVKKV